MAPPDRRKWQHNGHPAANSARIVMIRPGSALVAGYGSGGDGKAHPTISYGRAPFGLAHLAIHNHHIG